MLLNLPFTEIKKFYSLIWDILFSKKRYFIVFNKLCYKNFFFPKYAYVFWNYSGFVLIYKINILEFWLAGSKVFVRTSTELGLKDFVIKYITITRMFLELLIPMLLMCEQILCCESFGS